jgi:hypothetical protein
VIKNGGPKAYLRYPRPLQTEKGLEHRRNEMIYILFGTPVADWRKRKKKKAGIADTEMPLKINCRPKPKLFQ